MLSVVTRALSAVFRRVQFRTYRFKAPIGSSSGHLSLENKANQESQDFSDFHHFPLDAEIGQIRDELDAGLLLAAWGESLRRTASAKTIHDNLSALARFFDFAGRDSPGAITLQAVEEFARWQADAGAAAKTAENKVQSIRSFARWLVRRKVLAEDPLVDLPPAPKVETIPNFLSMEEQAECVRLAKGAGCHAEVVIALYAGLRMGELRLLTWQDVRFEAKMLVIPTTKSRHPRTVPLHPLALEVLRGQHEKSGQFLYVFAGGNARKDGTGGRGQWNRNRPRNKKTWGKIIKPITEAMPAFKRGPKRGVGRGWHLLRHTWASRLAQAGVSPYKLMKWGGWNSMQMVERYAHLAPAYDPDIEKL